MWPSFTVRVLQDPEIVHTFLGISRESWSVLAPWASALAIAYAAWVAAHYQRKKDKKHRKDMQRFYYSVLKQLEEQCDALDFHGYIVGGFENELYKNLFDDIRNSKDMIKNNFIEIIEFCPSDSIHEIFKIQSILNNYFFYMNDPELYEEDAYNFHQIWEEKLKSKLVVVLNIIDKEMRSFATQSNFASFNFKKRNSKNMKKSGDNTCGRI